MVDQKMLNDTETWLVLVGALNWGLAVFLNMNLVDKVLGSGSLWAKVVYGAVALSAVHMIIKKFN